jgi:putative ABC transport system permease protein
MFRFAPYILKNIWRQRTRTLLTVIGAAVALFVFTFVGAVGHGLYELTQGKQAERSLIVFQANRFCPFTSKLPEDYSVRIAKLPGVRDVVPIQVYMNNCRASLDVVVFHGLPPGKLRSARDIRLVSGSWEEFEKHRDAGLVGQAVARRRGLSVGQGFSIGELTITVAGIFQAAPAEENFIYTQLEFLQRTRGLHAVGTVTQFEVRLSDDADADAVARAIDDTFRGAQVVTDTRPRGVFEANVVGDLVDLIGFANYLGYACVGLVLALVATTTLMAVQDRVREHAVLQTLGFSGPRIFGIVLTESLIVSVVGGVLGVSLALGILRFSGLAVSTEGVTIAFLPSWSLLMTGLLVSASVGLFAGAVPAWQAGRADIVTSLRQV